tara:strand:+ start:725 stop:934 length:210 start_codon:yes stop_codon:yes gene_type:complete
MELKKGDEMNEKIKQLAEQAYLYQEHDNFLTAALENFAELIIQECIDYCGENLSKTVGGALKIHFGVKE